MGGRTKNFENWVLVELVNELLHSGFAGEVRTNGHFAKAKVKAADVPDLRGRKGRATHLSPDISARLPSGVRLSAEIKTGLTGIEILDDLRIVRHYNDQRIADRAEMGWVVLLPTTDKARKGSLKTFDRICADIQDKFRDFTLEVTNITEWLILVVAVPVPGGGPDQT